MARFETSLIIVLWAGKTFICNYCHCLPTHKNIISQVVTLYIKLIIFSLHDFVIIAIHYHAQGLSFHIHDHRKKSIMRLLIIHSGFYALLRVNDKYFTWVCYAQSGNGGGGGGGMGGGGGLLKCWWSKIRSHNALVINQRNITKCVI